MLLIALAWPAPARAAHVLAPELEHAAPGESFISLYAKAERAVAAETGAAPAPRFASWEMQDWANEAPVPARRARRVSSEARMAMPDRGRQLVLLGIAWLGRLAGH